MIEYTNSKIRESIAENIHNIEDRKMLEMRFIDGLTFEKIGFEMGMTTKTVRLRIHKHEETIFKDFPG